MQTDFIRVLLWGALLAICFMLWNAWDTEHPRSKVAQVPAEQVKLVQNQYAPNTLKENFDLSKSSNQLIEVQTDVLKVLIDPRGGNFVDVKLLKYSQSQDSKAPVNLLNPDPSTLYLAESSIKSLEGKQHNLVYQSEKSNYGLGQNKDEVIVTLQAKDPEKLLLEKTFHFKKGSYLIGVDYKLHNQSTAVFKGQLDEKLIRKKVAPPNKGFFHINPFIGAAYSTPAYPFEKLTFEDMQKSNLDQDVKSGWISMLQLYFLSAWIPDKTQTMRFYTQELGNDIFAIGMKSQPFALAAGDEFKTHSGLYVGPAIADTLNSIAPHLGLTVNYGWLWFISEWLLWCLKKIYWLVGNWGWSIVILTALIKLAFYHLSAKSYRSMAKMRLLQPRLESLKQRYGDDRQKLMQETMALYKKEQVNPMGGCLPILVQIPVFIALYWVLLESVELYQAPFILWVRDLSSPDPYYILPILMGLTMFVQQKLSPPPADPTQEKIMLFLPIVFTGLFLYFPAGLVLYWVVNNILSISQQWYVTQHYQPEKKSFKKK